MKNIIETHKEYLELVEILEEKNMICGENTVEVLENINYYKFKRLADPFYDRKTKKYIDGTNFDTILLNFYYDNDLSEELLKQCKRIELALKNKIAYILGKKYGAFGYLNFSNWCDRNIDKEKRIKSEEIFKENIYKRTLQEKKDNLIIKDFFDKYPEEEYLSIWRVIEILTLGESIFIYDMMNKKNKRYLSNEFGLTEEVFDSHIKNVRLIRNYVAHNITIIDMKFRTKPKYIDEFNNVLFENSRKILVGVFLILNLVKIVDKNYDFSRLKIILDKLIIDDEVAKRYGAINKKAIFEYIDRK